MLADGCDPSTIRNTLMPLRVIYRRAVSHGEISINPTTGLELPAVRGRRDRIATPEQAAQLLNALRAGDRAVWAVALYAGLRRGELMALRWQDIDLDRNLIRVERSWDIKAGLIEPKSRAGTRTVPVARLLREHLLAHKLRCPWRDGLAFGRPPTTPLSYSSLRERAHTDWQKAKLNPIGLHDCRHTFASLMIAAGVNAKALSTYMGHSSITMTLDRYGHLMPGNEQEAAQLLDRFLEPKRPASELRLAPFEPGCDLRPFT
jgi:integrase